MSQTLQHSENFWSFDLDQEMRKYLKNEYMDKRNKSKESGSTRQKRLPNPTEESERQIVFPLHALADRRPRDSCLVGEGILLNLVSRIFEGKVTQEKSSLGEIWKPWIRVFV